MLSSTLNTPFAVALLSSSSLTVMTSLADSVTTTESVSDNDSDRDEDEEENVSDNDLEILGDRTDTEDVVGNTNSTGVPSGGVEVPVKKTKIILTEEEQTFVKKLHPTVSKIDKTWKVALRHVSDRGSSLKK